MPYRPPRYGGYVGGYPQNVRGGALAAYAIGQGLQAFGDIWGQSIQARRDEEERVRAEANARVQTQVSEMSAPRGAGMEDALGRAAGVTTREGFQTEIARAGEFPSGTAQTPGGFLGTMPPAYPGQPQREDVGEVLASRQPVVQADTEKKDAEKRLDAALAAWNEGEKDPGKLAGYFGVGEGELGAKITGEEQTEELAALEVGGERLGVEKKGVDLDKAKLELTNLIASGNATDEDKMRALAMTATGLRILGVKAALAASRGEDITEEHLPDERQQGILALAMQLMKSHDSFLSGEMDETVVDGFVKQAEMLFDAFGRAAGGEGGDDTLVERFRREGSTEGWSQGDKDALDKALQNLPR